MKDIPCVGSLQLGQMYEPFSLEQLTSDNYISFLERALPIEAFSPARNVGGMILNTLFEERSPTLLADSPTTRMTRWTATLSRATRGSRRASPACRGTMRHPRGAATFT